MPQVTQEYEAKKLRSRNRSFEVSRVGRDIGSIPPVRYPRRKRLGLKSYQGFLEEYMPSRFPLDWGIHHISLIERVQSIILSGGLHAVAMPRGEGKTTTVEPSPIWAAIKGAHRYSMIIGNAEDKGCEMLESIKMELMYNDLLLEDFPELVYPIRMLEGEPRRALGQLHHGNRTNMKVAPDEIRLPVIPGSKASGAIIRATGLTGNIRGAVRTAQDGTRIRPTFVLIDDPQTDESARSPAQCEKRHSICNGAILGLPGPGKSIAALATMTCIRPEDLADRLLDRDQSPDWTGERTSMVIEFPTNEELWDRYNQLRRESLERFDDLRLANEHYQANREAMDEGAVVSWEARFDEGAGEVSAIQHAMNLLYRDERSFWAEYQNQPLPDTPPDNMILSVEEIRAKTNNHKRGKVPFEAELMTAHIDVQQNALFWTVGAFSQGFTGHIVDYGAFPKPRGDYFTLNTMKRGLSDLYPDRGYEGQLFAALEEVVGMIASEWAVDGARGTMRPSRILIDAAYGKSTDTVFQFCRMNRASSILLPAFGRAITASQRPMSEYTKKRGDRVGLNWRIPTVSRKRAIRHLIYDVNFWKSFTHSRLRTPLGEEGSLALFERSNSATAHRMYAENLTAESRIETEGRGRRIDEWLLPDKTRDNHFFDNTVGLHVAASIEGITMDELTPQGRPKGRKMKLSEIQAEKRRRRGA